MDNNQDKLVVIDPDPNITPYIREKAIKINRRVKRFLSGKRLFIRLFAIVNDLGTGFAITLTLCINTQREGDDFEVEVEDCFPFGEILGSIVIPLRNALEDPVAAQNALTELLNKHAEVSVEFSDEDDQELIDDLETPAEATIQIWGFISQAEFTFKEMFDFLDSPVAT